MARQNLGDLHIDVDFQRLASPISTEAWQSLRRSLLHDGCLRPVCVWENIIIDGHKRYAICKENNIPLHIQPFFFWRREAAMSWACLKRLSDGNINDSMRHYLIGKMYQSEIICFKHIGKDTSEYAGLRYSDDGLTPTKRAQEKISLQCNRARVTVARYGRYAKAIDRIRQVAPYTAKSILQDQPKFDIDNTVALGQLPLSKLRKLESKVYDRLKNMPLDVCTPELLLLLQSAIAVLNDDSRRMSIKDMPTYDPNASLQSLALTVPSWASSLERVSSSAEFFHSSKATRQRLKREVILLLNTAKQMLRKL